FPLLVNEIAGNRVGFEKRVFDGFVLASLPWLRGEGLGDDPIIRRFAFVLVAVNPASDFGSTERPGVVVVIDIVNVSGLV
ncbi:hypothetical protein M3M33_15005, partial [Loigolactobacillus coryniformis]|uniref:hypothetical protein n=1 Tax=Loigolactobacillus coryniformis TaxID=1610 RepID=UPI00201B18B1